MLSSPPESEGQLINEPTPRNSSLQADLQAIVDAQKSPEITGPKTETSPQEAIQAYQEWIDNLPYTPETADTLRMIDLYIQGVDLFDPEIARTTYGESAEEFQRMFDRLSGPVQAGARALYEQAVARHRENQEAESGLASQIPELLEGKLPPEAAEKVAGPYALAVNTSGPDQLDDAREYLRAMNGIPLLNYNLDQRFLITDSTADAGTTERTVSEGYFGHDRGRFIVVIPVSEASVAAEGAPRAVASQDYGNTEKPADFLVEAPDTGRGSDEAVNSKYIVGFIDGKNVWHPNPSFMTDDLAFQ